MYLPCICFIMRFDKMPFINSVIKRCFSLVHFLIQSHLHAKPSLSLFFSLAIGASNAGVALHFLLSDDLFPVSVLHCRSVFVLVLILSKQVCVCVRRQFSSRVNACACLPASFAETHFPSRPCQAVSGCTQLTAGGSCYHLLS